MKNSIKHSARKCSKMDSVSPSPSADLYILQTQCVCFLHFWLSLTCNEVEDKTKKGTVKKNVEIRLAFYIYFFSHSFHIFLKPPSHKSDKRNSLDCKNIPCFLIVGWCMRKPSRVCTVHSQNVMTLR
jgi:hypothetical protein